MDNAAQTLHSNVCAPLKIQIPAGLAWAVGPKRKKTLIDSPQEYLEWGVLSSEGKGRHLYRKRGREAGEAPYGPLQFTKPHILIFILQKPHYLNKQTKRLFLRQSGKCDLELSIRW